MPKITLDFSGKMMARLQTMTALYNDNSGVTLTVTQWLKAELTRLATQEELGRYLQRRQEELQAEGNQQLNDETEAERQRLIAEIS